MKLTLRLMASLPIVALCALLGGTASAHTITPSVSIQRHVQMAAHTLRPNDVTTTVNANGDGENLYQCSQGPESNCSVLTQLAAGDQVQVHCQLFMGSGSNGGWWSDVTVPNYSDTGWVSNVYLTAGPGQIAGVPTCSSK